MLRGTGLSRLVRRQGRVLGWWRAGQEGASERAYLPDTCRSHEVDGATDSTTCTLRETEQLWDSQMGRSFFIRRGFAQEASSKGDERNSGVYNSGDTPKGAESSAKFESVDSSKPKNASPIGEEVAQAFSSNQEAENRTPSGEDADVQPEILSRPEPDLMTYVGELFAQAKLSFAVMVMKRSVETGFDLEDFKKGAEVAFRAFMEYYPKGDFETLKNMVSPNLLKNLQAVWEEFKREGKVMECTLEELRGVQITGMDFFMRKPPLFEGVPQVPDYNENRWLTVSVRFDSTERYRLRSPEGKLKQHMLDKRGHVLQFVRQLPGFEKAPVEELDSPWYIVNV